MSGNEAKVDLALAGGGGENVDLWRTCLSHGLSSLPPMALDPAARTLTVTLALPRRRPRTVRIEPSGPGRAVVVFRGNAPSRREVEEALASVRRVLRLDEDLSGFYGLAQDDPALQWVTAGAGRMIRSQTVFEEVVKTICTTNCAWGATVRMVGALVEHLGERAPGAPRAGSAGRTFPTAEAMASAGDAFYRDVMRAGYRGRYLIDLARSVVAGAVELEDLGSSTGGTLTDAEVEARLLALPGVGPYAAAHIMMMLGRYSRLILDSWTRPKYARLVGRRVIKDSAIERRFRAYGSYAGLAFWLYLTRDWVPETG